MLLTHRRRANIHIYTHAIDFSHNKKSTTTTNLVCLREMNTVRVLRHIATKPIQIAPLLFFFWIPFTTFHTFAVYVYFPICSFTEWNAMCNALRTNEPHFTATKRLN